MLSGYTNPHPPGCFWHEAAEKFGASNIKWCEQTLCNVISEPANTWSNLALLAFGLLIYKMAKSSRSSALKWIPFAFLFMAAASFFYHASNFYISQVFDFLGIYLLIHWLLALNLIRARIFKTKGALIFYAAFIVMNSLALHLMYLFHYKFQVLVAFAGVLIFVTEFWARKKGSTPSQTIWFKLSAGTIIIAQSFSLVDLTRVMCEPSNHLVQGHAIWHILSGLSLFFYFKHIRQFDSELP